MASTTKISYQRLRNEGGLDDYDLGAFGYSGEGRRVGRVSSWRRRYRRVYIRRKVKIRIPSLKKLLRRKAKVVVSSWSKVLKRLKESQSHFGDLFAGNYLFLQVTPTSLKYLEKSSNSHQFSSAYYLPKVS